MDDKKRISITPDGLMLLYPTATGDNGNTPQFGPADSQSGKSGLYGSMPGNSNGLVASITADEFEDKYRGFINNTVSPEEFIRLCNLALAQDAGPLPTPPEVPSPEDILENLLRALPEPPASAQTPPDGTSAEDWRSNWAFLDPQLWADSWPGIWPQIWLAEQERSAREIHILKYLALMRTGGYYEAMSIATIMERRFDDVMKAHEIRATVNMRRDNVDAALANLAALLSYCHENGLDSSEYEYDRQELLKRKDRTRYYEASRFWRAIAKDRTGALLKFAGVPLIIRGRAVLRVNKESRDRYLLFDLDNGEWISCQLPANEIPFISRVNFPAEVEVHGFLLNASERLILLYPSRFIKVIS